MTNSEDDYILDVERVIIEDFLRLLRDNFVKAREATYFLEMKEGMSNVIGITNIRDVVSHFVSALNPNITQDERRVHLSNAEEHLRRATLEPYERAINRRLIKFRNLYDQYKAQVVPIIEENPHFSNAPNLVAIEATLANIEELTVKGRDAKGKSLRDTRWEEGVDALIEAYGKLRELHSEVEGYWNIYQQMRTSERTEETTQQLLRANRRQKLLAIWALVATLIGLFATVIAVILAL